MCAKNYHLEAATERRSTSHSTFFQHASDHNTCSNLVTLLTSVLQIYYGLHCISHTFPRISNRIVEHIFCKTGFQEDPEIRSNY